MDPGNSIHDKWGTLNVILFGILLPLCQNIVCEDLRIAAVMSVSKAQMKLRLKVNSSAQFLVR